MAEDRIAIENAQLAFRNFSGKEGRYNPAGRRTFCVILPDEVGKDLLDRGWNVKTLEPRDADEEPRMYISVEVRFSKENPQFNPKIVMINDHGRDTLGEGTVNILDGVDIKNADVILRGYHWSMPDGKSGVKAMLKTLYITIQEDEFESKYTNVPDSAMNTMTFERIQKTVVEED